MVQMVNNLPATWETQVQSLGREDPLEKEMAAHSSVLAWRILEQRSLAGYSPWGCKELDMTERLTHLESNKGAAKNSRSAQAWVLPPQASHR